MSEHNDTELLLALLSSLIKGPSLPHNVMLEALIDAGGDVNLAADKLNETNGSFKIAGVKRKRPSKLDTWLVNKKVAKEEVSAHEDEDCANLVNMRAVDEHLAVEQSPGGSSKKSPWSSNKDSVPLMTILRQAPTENKGVPKLLPRTLATPLLVSQNTPCTLHPSILPPKLACRLFYAMLREASSWKRNKW